MPRTGRPPGGRGAAPCSPTSSSHKSAKPTPPAGPPGSSLPTSASLPAPSSPASGARPTGTSAAPSPTGRVPTPPGERTTQAKLDEPRVLEIRRRGPWRDVRSLAARHGVCTRSICQVVTGSPGSTLANRRALRRLVCPLFRRRRPPTPTSSGRLGNRGGTRRRLLVYHRLTIRS